MSTKKQRNGISLRTIHILLVIGAVVLAGIMLNSTFYLSSSFRSLTEISEQNTELQKASYVLLSASDYLTERVQRFVISGDKQQLEEYFDEALSLKHREEAVTKMSSGTNSKAASKKLKNAMDASEQLMKREYYAFKLVIEAENIKDYPEQLKYVVLSERDSKLSAHEKMHRAADIVSDNDYYSQKHLINKNMRASLDELEKAADASYDEALGNMRIWMAVERVLIVLSTIILFFLVWLASHLGIRPVIHAVEHINSNDKIPEAGTAEFRSLVRAYNHTYEMYRQSLEKLDFKASHDELTGVFNRTGYESLISTIDLENTYMLLFDVDNFKTINDTYGHKTGDMVLQKLVGALEKHFRPDDFICRVGGDEFVVLMQHTPEKKEALIASKIDEINKELDETSDELPNLSISVGVAHGSKSKSIDELFKKADKAMYSSKQSGKSTYTFYSSEQRSDK